MPDLAIAVDGPGSSGKGTVARGVARKLGYQYVDTGAMYRAVALEALRRGVSWDDGAGLAAMAAGLEFQFTWDGDVLLLTVDGSDVTAEIRRDEIGVGASRVSVHPALRAALLEQQRGLGRARSVVMDGRDIGTVVLPDADLKIWLDADLDERARRRHEELVRRGETVHLAEVRQTLADRDHRDASRSASPMRAATDAVRIDSTELTIPAVIARVVQLARERGAEPPPAV